MVLVKEDHIDLGTDQRILMGGQSGLQLLTLEQQLYLFDLLLLSSKQQLQALLLSYYLSLLIIEVARLLNINCTEI